MLNIITTPPSGEDQERMRSAGAGALRNPIKALRPVAPGLMRKAFQIGPATALVGLLPAGLFPTLFLRRFGADMPWPSQLWVPSVRIDDGCVVVFGRDPIPATLADAVEATQAVPTLFQPKVINGGRYVDGAVASSTHADILIPEDLDVALIAAPMARPGRGLIRSRARRALAAEARDLRQSGTRTLILTPDAAVLAAAEGFPRRRSSAGADIVEAARRQTIAAFETQRSGRTGQSGVSDH